MSNKELLELAAKAVGYEIDEHARNGSAWAWVYPKGSIADADGDFPIFKWSPCNNDGDGARLEAALGIHVAWHSDGVVCGLRWAGATELVDDHGGDKQAARRMASLRVAAEHGKAMP